MTILMGTQVIKTVCQSQCLRISKTFVHFLDAPMDIATVCINLTNNFTLQRNTEAHDTMGCRMLRTNVDYIFFFAEEFGFFVFDCPVRVQLYFPGRVKRASMTLMIGMFCRYQLEINVDITRIGAQVMSGIGFLGVGTIFIRDRTQVTGVTTAAGLWTTAAIGLSIGAGFYLGSLLCAFIVVVTMSILANVEKNKKQSFTFTKLYAELQESKNVMDLQCALREADLFFENFSVCTPHSGMLGHLGIEMNILSNDSYLFIKTLQQLSYVNFVVISD